MRAELAEAKGEASEERPRVTKGHRAPKGRRNDAAYSSRVVGLDEPQTTRSSGTSRVWRFSQCGVRVDFSVGRRSRTHAFVSGQTKRRHDVSRLILHRVGCRVGEASNPGPVLLEGIPVPSSDDEPVSAFVPHRLNQHQGRCQLGGQ